MQSQEGAALIDVQTTALFGNLRDLQVQMQNAVGQDATSVEELMQKVQVQWLLRCSIIDMMLMLLLFIHLPVALKLGCICTVCLGCPYHMEVCILTWQNPMFTSMYNDTA